MREGHVATKLGGETGRVRHPCRKDTIGSRSMKIMHDDFQRYIEQLVRAVPPRQ